MSETGANLPGAWGTPNPAAVPAVPAAGAATAPAAPDAPKGDDEPPKAPVADDAAQTIVQAEKDARAKLMEAARIEAAKTTVPMVRDPQQYPKPHSADVHIKEVSNYTAGGWQLKVD